MRDNYFQIKFALQTGRLSDDFMKKDEHRKTDMGISFTDDDLRYLTLFNKLLQSLLFPMRLLTVNHVQELHPSTSLDENSLAFEFKTDRSIYLDLRDIHLQIKVALQLGRLFADSTKKDEHGKVDVGMSFTDDDLRYVTLFSNLLHSLLFPMRLLIVNQIIP